MLFRSNGEKRIAEIYGNKVVVIPYVMPGFDLARLCAELFPKHAGADTIGMVLMNHGIFSFGATARESYERMIALVDMAERYLEKHSAWSLEQKNGKAAPAPSNELAQLRASISSTAGFPLVMASHVEIGRAHV